VTQFFFLEEKTAKEIHKRIFSSLGDSSPFYETVRNLWVNKIKRGKISNEDAPCFEDPRTVVTSEIR